MRPVAALLALASLGVGLASSGVAAAQASSPITLLRPNPDDSVHVDAYLGVDYVVVDRNIPSYQVQGLSLQPYVLKTADVEITNLSHFDFALNAAVTSFLAAGGFAQPADTSSSADTSQAERYAALLAYALGSKVKLRTEAHFARLATYITPTFQNASSYSVTTYSAPAGGGLARMHPGDGIGGNTDWNSAAFEFVLLGDFLGFGGETAIGYRYFQLDSLTPYLMRDAGSAPVLQAVVADQFSCNAADWSFGGTRTVFPHVDAQTTLYVGAGYAQTTSALINPTNSVCFAFGGNGAFSYTTEHWSVTLGMNFDRLGAFPVGGGDTLRQGVSYNNLRNGRVASAPAGSTWGFAGPVEDLYTYGPYLHITAHY